MMKRWGLLWCLLAVVVACGDTGDASDAGSGGKQGRDAVRLDPPAAGFQLRATERVVDASGDVQWCEVMQVPGDPSEVFHIEAFDVALGSGSHHANVMAVLPGSPADVNTAVGDVEPCLLNGIDPFGEGLRSVTGGAGTLTETRFPEGVGIVLHGGDKLVFNIHYVNARDEPVIGGMVINAHVADGAAVDREVQRMAFYNSGIRIPAGTERSFEMECMFNQDVDVHQLSRHTHAMGTDFAAYFSGGPRDGEEIFVSHSWSEDLYFKQDPPLRVEAGDGLRFRCDFVNTTDGDLVHGELGSDEMCILYGLWTVADAAEMPVNHNCVTTFSIPGQVSAGFSCPDPQCP